jgi:hypothetical protein
LRELVEQDEMDKRKRDKNPLFCNIGSLVKKKEKSTEEIEKDKLTMDSIFGKTACYDIF